ncbi:PadR family transcriptional regulator [Ochrobactrum soli]|uniref:PadR family transcriptional regulator n=1 Tax=Ochrobactrum soli TaxID=2448455 RepID=A0A849KLX5_9HYPH|nr:PadR family transcriptional regulator [[Ochrobactrum] soli]NNU59539.1 PadR family transcriptional regulator [[Ochrobactrum] soli]
MTNTSNGDPDRPNHPEQEETRHRHGRHGDHRGGHRGGPFGGRGRHRGEHSREDYDEHRGERRGGRGGHRRERIFDYGDLRLLVLTMIAERPRHGYELIKDISERLQGIYTPSPGVIYPTLSWLDDMGYTVTEPGVSGKKLNRITAEGEAFLVANRAAADALLSRISSFAENNGEMPHTVIHALKSLKMTVRQRLHRGPMDAASAEAIVTALNEAARIVEES